MRICSVHGSLDTAFRELGHEVLSLRPGPGFFALDSALAEQGFAPDLVVQQERLGPRTLLQGLGAFSCPRVFWSIDTHLNSFWQLPYGRLFDLVLTTQQSWVARLTSQGLPRVAWLPWFGFEHAWTPWSRRRFKTSFVGRVTAHRPVRQAFTAFLSQEFGTTIHQELPFKDMVAVYADTHLVPNESILGEVNFRTFEAASCGCVVVCQGPGEDLDPLFEHGREILVYDHALELKEILNQALARTDRMRGIGAAARDRVHREHLPRHRAERVLDLAAGCPVETGAADRAGLLLTRFELWQAGRLDLQGERLLADLVRLPPAPEVLAAVIALTLRLRTTDQVLALLVKILAGKQGQVEWRVNLAGSMAALKLGSFDLARQFWYRQARSRKSKQPPVSDPLEIYLAWSRELVRLGRPLRPGFVFDPKIHLPAAALECLLSAHAKRPESLRVQRQMNGLLATFRGTEQVRMGLLSSLTMRDQDNWRDGLELAMVNLRIFRIRQGLEEAAAARDAACSNGEEQRFYRLLAGMDPGGTLAQTLKQLQLH